MSLYGKPGDKPEQPDIERIELEIQRFTSTFQINLAGVQDNTELRYRLEEAGKRLLLILEREILGQKTTQVFNTEAVVPLSWWEHCKRDLLYKLSWMPHWIIQKYPVRTRTETRSVTVEARALFPDLNFDRMSRHSPVFFYMAKLRNCEIMQGVAYDTRRI